ncbi:hypothetical protein [Streptomyces alkaliphilus]|uniref:hypothetical protein n=1 Tax=Streptomyces alkaliphilus TaxID=1472722 RepID=UPI00117DC6A6|nr:hypothetical protein [Streptomyces alkaliphilus]MQS06009.1 hypothetical protein [Streptomyces alkaliphilus]
MSSRKGPSAADRQLIDHAQRHGFTVTAKQLATWRRSMLLPGNILGRGLGRGRGRTSRPAPESFDLVLGLASHAGTGKRPSDLALLLFAEGLPVPEMTVREAFRAAVAFTVPGEDDNPERDPEERLDRLGAHLSVGGQVVTLVPARARRIDERVARILREAASAWPPAELADLDHKPESASLTPEGATLTAYGATLNGSLSIDEIGIVLRALAPELPVNPIASLVETTGDIPDVAAQILNTDSALAFLPSGDVRDHLRHLAHTAPLGNLAAAWDAAQRVRTWALNLCERIETELEAGRPGEAFEEWLRGRQTMSGLAVLEALRDRRWSPSKGALSALVLLFQREQFDLLDGLVPGCQWHLLKTPGMLPPPIRDLLKDLIDQEPASTEPVTD